ncbi:MAG: tripartite tricarboxylate transporter substrate binding protein [Proteobacteria bacterium]|nr:tripartite tricarboxylate transporter substrate binding protein [Pseudomonadota bacterium]
MITRRSTIAALACLGMATGAAAASFPDKPIRLVVPFAPGGASDVLGRLIAKQLQELYQQPVVVENKAGAGGHIGGEFVARSPADGYTLLLGLPSVQGSYTIYPKLNYDPSKAFDTLTVIGTTPSVVLVNTELPVKTIGDLIRYARENPGKLDYGSAGVGAGTHLAPEMFKQATGIQMAHVPYKGSSAAATDLMGGQIQVMFENLPTALPLTKSGKVRAIAVTSLQRVPLAPDLPTVAEQGVPNFEFAAFYTIAAPTGLPAEVAKKLSADLDKIIRSPALAERWHTLGITPIGGTPTQANQYVREQAQRLNKLVKDAGLIGS